MNSFAVDRATRIERALLVAWDLLVAIAAFGSTRPFGDHFDALLATLLMGLLAPAVISGAGAYPRTSWLRTHRLQIARRLVVASTVVSWSAVLVALALGRKAHLLPLVLSWLGMALAWYTGRRIAALIRRRRPERILIVGSGVVARRVIALARRPSSAAVVLGSVDDGVIGERPEDPPILGDIDRLPQLLADGGIDRVIVTFSERPDDQTVERLRNATAYCGVIDIVPRFFDFVGPAATTYQADGLAFLSIPGRHISWVQLALKRAFDLAISSFLVAVLSPVLLIIAAAVFIDGGRPILFRQRRIGMHGTSFSIIKFRTLHPTSEAELENIELGLALPSIGVHVEQTKNEAMERATRVGAVLRRNSLDELPQLFNVLSGHMSLIGPRPLSPLEDAMLTGWECRRRDMRPGITGLWQVSGRSEISWEDRISLDYAQVRHWSLSADLQILADTLRAVIERRGAS